MNKKRSKYRIPVLVCGEIGLVHSLGIEGIPVVAGSNIERNPAFCSYYANETILFPDYETDEFIERLCEFGEEQRQKPVLITDDDQAALAISRHRDKLAKYYLFLMPEPKVVEILQDKHLFHKKALKLNLPVPASFKVSSFAELDSLNSEITFPCILKPVNKEDWWHKDFQKKIGSYQKAFRCGSRDELYKRYQSISTINPRVIVQESIEGPDDQHFSVNMYIDRRGEVKGYFIYQKMRMCPPGAGRGSFFVTVWDKEVLDKAKTITSKLDIRGLVNLQFKRDIRTDVLKLIEMEPRLSVSNFLGPAAGANLAALYYYDLIGEQIPAVNGFRPGVKYSDPLRDLKAMPEYLKQGEISLWDWLRSYKGKVVCNGYLLRDPWPIVMSLWFIINRRFGKPNFD